MTEYLKISEDIRALGLEAEREIRPYFSRIEEICDRNTEKMLAAFAKNRVSDNLFAGTTGYGYDDYGRDTLDRIYADIFGTEAALVRIGFVNGTHALSCAMFSAVKTGDTVLSVTGPAYDTLQNTITGDYCGSMKSYGIGYKQVDLVNGVPDLPAIREAAKTACIADDIEGFANGYETMVGERGVTLSGGQKQRVAIARMLTQKTPVTVFDDSLSAVDTQTDEKIRAALARERKGTTSIIISHRITTLLDCDNILVLDHGKVLQLGTPAELLREEGLFRQIYDMQMAIGEEAET